MNHELIEKKFEKMGALAKVTDLSPGFASGRGAPAQVWPRIDIRQDQQRKERYLVQRPPGCTLEVVDLKPEQRHLLLMATTAQGKAKFLCGHDERHWFVAAVPGDHVKDVRGAQLALQPREVHEAAKRAGLHPNSMTTRKNRAFIRQGEWFFVPAPRYQAPAQEVLHFEPISRGRGSTPHIVEFLHRTGGIDVWVHPTIAENGINPATYASLPLQIRRRPGWRPMKLDAKVYARGNVTHRDHAVVTLFGWHRVYMNTEAKATWAPAVVFLD